MWKRRTAGISKVIGKRRWAEADARNVVSSWQRSGKRVSEFAREYGLTSQRLVRWSERLQGGSRGSVRFHPVRLVGGEREGERGGERDAIEVLLLDGRRVRVRERFSSEELGRVLEVLEGRA